MEWAVIGRGAHRGSGRDRSRGATAEGSEVSLTYLIHVRRIVRAGVVRVPVREVAWSTRLLLALRWLLLLLLLLLLLRLLRLRLWLGSRSGGRLGRRSVHTTTKCLSTQSCVRRGVATAIIYIGGLRAAGRRITRCARYGGVLRGALHRRRSSIGAATPLRRRSGVVWAKAALMAILGAIVILMSPALLCLMVSSIVRGIVGRSRREGAEMRVLMMRRLTKIGRVRIVRTRLLSRRWLARRLTEGIVGFRRGRRCRVSVLTVTIKLTVWLRRRRRVTGGVGRSVHDSVGRSLTDGRRRGHARIVGRWGSVRGG